MSEKGSNAAFIERLFFHKRQPVKINTLMTALLGIMAVVLSVGVVLSVNHTMKKKALEDAREKSLLLLERNLAIHAYFTHRLKPFLFRRMSPLLLPANFHAVWMSSTFAVREVDRYAKKLDAEERGGGDGNHYYYKEAAIDARSPANEADSYERQFIAELNRDPGLVERSGVRRLEDRPYFITLRRGETMEQSCLRCHSTPARAPAELVAQYGAERSFGRKEGDVVSAISIRIPLSVPYAGANRFSVKLTLLLLGIFLAVSLVYHWVLKRFLMTPLSDVSDMAAKIANDPAQLGEKLPIHLGRELSELATAFNLMSENLRQGRDELEQRVQERTAELSDANTRLSGALEQKEILLREVHHRVKNNLTMISSILGIQARYLDDPKALAAFEQNKSRIRSMALLHEKLYRTDDLSDINFRHYIEDLCRQLLTAGRQRPGAVKTTVDIPDISFNIDTSIPLALIVTELVSNALKHAFPGERSESGPPAGITVSLRREEDNYILSVKDNGTGIPGKEAWEKKTQLGNHLVSLLVRQINGSLDIIPSPGTTINITFPKRAAEERQ